MPGFFGFARRRPSNFHVKRMGNSLKIELSGTVAVCCVHDREKRRVTTESQVAELGKLVGQTYDATQHKLHLCACCDNLFVDPSDTPRFCSTCLRRPTHPLGGPLPAPKGVIA